MRVRKSITYQKVTLQFKIRPVLLPRSREERRQSKSLPSQSKRKRSPAPQNSKLHSNLRKQFRVGAIFYEVPSSSSKTGQEIIAAPVTSAGPNKKKVKLEMEEESKRDADEQLLRQLGADEDADDINGGEDDEDDNIAEILGAGLEDEEDDAGLVVEIPDDDGIEEAASEKPAKSEKKGISDKEFYKAMQKLKDRGNNAVPPKKSASAYILFGKEKRAEILKRNPLAKVTEVVKEIAQSWKLLNKEERQRFKEAAKKDKERYERELKKLENHSDLLKKPKKCLSAYMIFVKETRPQIVDDHPEMGALQVMQEVGKKWQAMTAAERQYFKKKAD